MTLLPPTSQHTIGPFFPQGFCRPVDNDLRRIAPDAPPSTAGEAIRLRGLVLREAGVPCVNAVVEAWQADAAGRFRHPADPDWQRADADFLGWGRVCTDAAGEFEFITLLPGGYAEGNHHRAPHVNLTILASGLMRPLATTIFFPDFAAANAADPVLGLVPPEARSRLVAVAEPQREGHRSFRCDLRLRGGPETPFFAE